MLTNGSGCALIQKLCNEDRYIMRSLAEVVIPQENPWQHELLSFHIHDRPLQKIPGSCGESGSSVSGCFQSQSGRLNKTAASAVFVPS